MYRINMGARSPFESAELPAMMAPDDHLFAGQTTEAPPALFADIVFDRPLDHAYTYSVPDHLRDKIGVGKRVECPFGDGRSSSSSTISSTSL